MPFVHFAYINTIYDIAILDIYASVLWTYSLGNLSSRISENRRHLHIYITTLLITLTLRESGMGRFVFQITKIITWFDHC